MNTLTKTPPRPRLSTAEVMQQVSERAPQLVPHCFLDRDWIWLCNVDLRGDANKPAREALKQIGFRFSPKGHVMQDGVTIGTWSHSCQRPCFPRRFIKHKGSAPEPDEK
jgi:hypothetical protein